MAENKKEPTASEAMFFFAIVKHTRNKADIDWAAVAVEQGFKNAEVAKVRFGQVKRKLGISSTTIPESPTSATKVTPKKGRVVNGPGASSAAFSVISGTSSKVTKNTGHTRAKKRGRVIKKVKEENSGDEDEATVDMDEDIYIKPSLLGSAEQFEEDMKSMINEDDPF
ncbi:hypothetical protein DCS_07729 [Drechmeria coniospora]|uniref:Myb-like DNA-binding domain-containing protein n=1 Tax=Drechmeria coniospora TaxID=98403 RepID=A0A151GF90_DRECN|nr:hypothetical protein DCS_07729 [Drechmeria coniospora]KYK55765.1 hypothetical protein DCS_07729 [Drechmeria coniospora]ODA81636.1 hypothetical protein RJ55_00137 [Drechmeria coniospora]